MNIQDLRAWYNPEPVWQYDYRPFVTYEIIIPSSLPSRPEQALQFAYAMSQSEVPVICELIATSTRIHMYLTTSFLQSDILIKQLQTTYPDIITRKVEMSLKDFQPKTDNYYNGVLDFCLEHESILPLKTPMRGTLTSLNGIIPLMETLQEEERIIYQVISQKALNPWANHLQNSGTIDGKALFKDSPEFQKGLEEKMQFPLCFVTVKGLVYAKTLKRKQYLEKTLSKAIISYTNTQFNSLQVAHDKGYTSWKHIEEVEERKTRRHGILLNVAELATLFHIPSVHLRQGKLQVKEKTSKAVVSELRGHETLIGINTHHNISKPVTISIPQRLRHTHIIGGTGAGKSTLLLHLMKQDADNGHGFCLLDPHGDLIDKIIGHIAPNRRDDVILIDPSDSEFPLGINLLHASTESQKIVLSSDLTGLFRKFSTSWGDQMEALLSNAINVLLEWKKPSTLLHLRRFLTDTTFQKEVLEDINDPYLSTFWETDFKLMRKGVATSITTRLDTFLRPKVIRGMMNQTGGIDFAEVLNNKKILLVKLSQGLIGTSNAFLLGSLITAKLYQFVQERQKMDAKLRYPFFLYMDEFQNFITPSMEALLSGARKFGLGLILAHQNLEQLQNAHITSSLLANAGIQAIFRVGVSDGKKLEQGFKDFNNDDFQELSIGEAIIRVQRSDWNCNISTTLLPKGEFDNYEYVQKRSRKLYSKPQEEVYVTKKSKANIQPSKKEVTKVNEKLKTEPVKEKDVVSSLPKFKSPQSPERNLEIEAEQFKEQERKRLANRKHRKLQEGIAIIGKKYNWSTYIEHQVHNPKGMIDVAIHTGSIKIAVEVSVTNSIDYEVKNIQKCLSNEYDIVFICCEEARHLDNIYKRAKENIDNQIFSKVLKGNFQELDAMLHRLYKDLQPKEHTVGRFKVRTKFTQKRGLGSREDILKILLNSKKK